MCVSTDTAEFSGTILYAGRRRHERHGWIEVAGYQNTAVNLSTGPNAMVLHYPTSAMSPDQFIPVGRNADVLTRMVDAARPVYRSGAAVMGGMDAGVTVFDHDIYTVVLATDPTRIPAALDQVPEHKRPRLRPELFEFYADTFPDHTIVLCCFDNAEARQAKPLLLWYRPADQDRLVLPALDSHTGEVPDLDTPVRPDHWLVFGDDDAPEGWGTTVTHSRGMRRKLRAFLPDTVVGVHLAGDPLPNGDFALSRADLLDGDLEKITRLRPG